MLQPTAKAQAEGQDAVQENWDRLSTRYQSQEARPVVPLRGYLDHENPITQAKVVAEIQAQAAARTADADGVHIQLLKTLQDTGLILLLTDLFWRCAQQGKTPRSWNRTDIFLLTKEISQPRDADNVRPISIIAIFHKIFERLLL